MQSRKRAVHVIPYLGWNRAGTEAFDSARIGLVKKLDRLLLRLQSSSELPPVLLGEHTAVLRDYLEIRPQMAPELFALAQEGRLLVGCWYVMPDDFLASPEALVRNLLLGANDAFRLGIAVGPCVLPASWGHIGQLPQILQQLNVATALATGEGLDKAQWWSAADGSVVLLLKFSTSLIGSDSTGQLAQDPIESTFVISDGFLADGALVVPKPQSRKAKSTVLKAETSLETLVASLQQGDAVTAYHSGEIRSPRRFHPHSGTLSARGWVKQRNWYIETELEKWLEPNVAWLTHHAVDEASKTHSGELLDFIDYSWRLLLNAQSDRLLQGLAVDSVFDELDAQLSKIERLNERLTNETLKSLADLVCTRPDDSEGERVVDEAALAIVVFNASHNVQTSLVSLSWDALTSLAGPVDVLDVNGKVVVSVSNPASLEEPTSPSALSFIASDVPAHGLRTFYVRPADLSSGYPEALPVSSTGTSIENDLLHFEIDQHSGVGEIFDKRTGRSFSVINQYIDMGDSGHLGSYMPPIRDTIIDIATNTPLRIRTGVSAVEQTMHVFQIYRLPEKLTDTRTSRLPLAAQFVPISISTWYRLVPGIPRIDVEVSLSNAAHNHRLQARFLTGLHASHADFDGHFEVVSRAIESDSILSQASLEDQSPVEFAQRGFVTVQGDDSGLTIANVGLPEVGVVARPQGVEITLTLLRAVDRLVENNRVFHTPKAQMPGELHFSYSIIPHGNARIEAWQQAWQYQVPLRAVVTSLHKGRIPHMAGLIESLHPLFIVSAIKASRTGNHLIVRGYSISNMNERIRLRLGFEANHVEAVLLDEKTLDADTVCEWIGDENSLEIKIRPHRIVTLRFSKQSGAF